MKILYGVEYRNFRTAMHGLFLYDDIDTACQVDNELSEFESIDFSLDDEPFALEAIREDLMVQDYDLSEIDWRQVEWDDEMPGYVYRPPFDDDMVVVVVNQGHIVYDIFGM